MADLLFSCLDSADLLELNKQQHYLFGKCKAVKPVVSHTRDTLPYKLSEYCLVHSLPLSEARAINPNHQNFCACHMVTIFFDPSLVSVKVFFQNLFHSKKVKTF